MAYAGGRVNFSGKRQSGAISRLTRDIRRTQVCEIVICRHSAGDPYPNDYFGPYAPSQFLSSNLMGYHIEYPLLIIKVNLQITATYPRFPIRSKMLIQRENLINPPCASKQIMMSV